MDAALTTVDELIGVYHARGSLTGELAYALGKVTGRAHCSLCDITHRTIRRRSEFETWRRSLTVPLRLVHLDERAADVQAATEGHTPCLLARADMGLVFLLGPDDLAGCGRDVDRLAAAVTRALGEHGLTLPA